MAYVDVCLELIRVKGAEAYRYSTDLAMPANPPRGVLFSRRGVRQALAFLLCGRAMPDSYPPHTPAGR